MARIWFRLLPFRSPLLRECLLLRVLRCFSSPGALYSAYVFNRECLDITPGGLPHSDIDGSTLASSFPSLIAGSHVLLRLLVPRHPPRTLSSLSCPITTPQALKSGLVRGSNTAFGLLTEISNQKHALVSRTFLTYSVVNVLVEMSGLEPPTPCLQSRCSPS